MTRRPVKEPPAPAPQTDHGIRTVPGARGVMFCLSAAVWTPPADMMETDGALLILLEAPGVRPEELSLCFRQGALVIRGRRPREAAEGGGTWRLSEIHYGAFERVFEIPEDYDRERMEMEYSDGFVRVRIPRRPGARREKKTLNCKRIRIE